MMALNEDILNIVEKAENRVEITDFGWQFE